MIFQLFEPFREWVYKTRRRKGSKKPFGGATLEGARVGRGGGIHRSPALGEIILRPEPPVGEFIAKQRSPEASWLNIKQLTEPSL